MLDRLLRFLRDRSDQAFDRRHGVETARPVPLPSFAGVDDKVRRDAIGYLPTGIPRFIRLVRKSGIVPGDYHFVDLGCGKGRLLFLADAMGFQTVTGVELDSELFEIACSNLKTWRASHPGSKIHLLHADAQTAALPSGNLFVFLSNPFTGDVLHTVAERLATLARQGCCLVIGLGGDEHAIALDDTGAFHRRQVRPLRWWLSSSLSIFEAKPGLQEDASQA